MPEDYLKLNIEQETERIVEFLRQTVLGDLRRRGAVVGISGGIDSSVVLALCARAFGAQRVLGLLLPEAESSPDSERLAHVLAAHYDIQTITEDITPMLEGFGCYRRRDEAIRRMFPEFTIGWKAKIVLPGNLLEHGTLNIFSLTVIDPAGQEYTKRLPPSEYAQIVAASNFKQRSRMAMLYYHAECRNYAVVGTPNRDERDLGFFVKWGDGGVDLNPIVHLFKMQVYQLARYLEVPAEILDRIPTTDTYSAGSTQEEFFFRVPFHILDTIWHGHENGRPRADMAEDLDLTEEQVQRVIDDIARKERTTAYLRMPPVDLTAAEEPRGK